MNDTVDPTGSVISVQEIEALTDSVFPWQLDMRQVSSGPMQGLLRLGQVDEILVTREQWSEKTVCVGKCPLGYLAISGLASTKPFRWCGHEIGPRQLVCGYDAADVDFATPRSANHWVALIPLETLVDYVGEEAVTALRGRRVLESEPNLSLRLLAIANRAVSPHTGFSETELGRVSGKALRASLLDAVAQLVIGDGSKRHDSNAQQRHEICCRAIAFVENFRAPISVPELAAAVGAKRRTLERAFRETLGIAPYRFMRLHRLNRLHRSLRMADLGQRKVTDVASEWGFKELGRTAVEYKRLFGESPSSTLSSPAAQRGLRLADALAGWPPK